MGLFGRRRLSTITNRGDVLLKGRVAESFAERLKGLIGTDAGNPDDNILVIENCRSIHTFGMHYAIDVAVVDGSGTVRKAVRGLVPMRFLGVRAIEGGRERYTFIEREAHPSPWFQVGDRIMAVGDGTGPS